MTDYGGWVTGIAPKKPGLISIKPGSKNHINAIREYELEFEKLQIDAGFTFISESQVSWRDLSYVFETLDGVRNSGLITIYGDRLCLIKKIFMEYPDTKKGILVKILSKKEIQGCKRKFSIIGPYTLYRISNVINYDKEKLITKIYEEILEESIDLGFDAVDFHEPYIGYEEEVDQWLARRLYNLIDSFPSLRIFVYPYYTDYTRKLNLLIQISRDGILIDMNSMGIDEIIPLPVDRIIIGLDDIVIEEDITSLSQRIKRLTREIRYREVDITYPYTLNTLSYNMMIRKVRLIGLLMRVLRK
jgi:methionine synthase II (cobalamin-independent)